MKDTVLILGITGQDGITLAKSYLKRDYNVIGTSRDIANSRFNHIFSRFSSKKLKLIEINQLDWEKVAELIKTYQPKYIFNLIGPSSVFDSFSRPYHYYHFIYLNVLYFLEAIRLYSKKDIRFFNAGSTDCFGDNGRKIVTESTEFKPLSPYAYSKVSACNLVKSYRENHDIFCVNGYLSNHESKLRPKTFIIPKIIHTAHDIAWGKEKKLSIGNIDISRDWGWSEDYMEACQRIIEAETPSDYIVCTGVTTSLRSVIKNAFDFHNLDYKKYIEIDKSLLRTNEIKNIRLSPNKINRNLKWKATKKIKEIIKILSENLIKTN